MDALRILLDDNANDLSRELLRIACVVYLHQKNRKTEKEEKKTPIYYLSEKVKVKLFEELVFLLFNNGGDTTHNFELLKQLQLGSLDLSLLQNKTDLLQLLPTDLSNTFEELFKAEVTPLVSKQTELQVEREKEVLEEKDYKESLSCANELTEFNNKLLEKERIPISLQKLLNLKKCSDERQKSMELLKNH